MSQDTTGDHLISQGHAEVLDGIFARRLAALRKATGLTQQQLAAAMAAGGSTMHRSAIAKIEAGDRAVSVGEAVQLAGVLGVDVAELVTERALDARTRAQLEVRALQREAGERHAELEEARIMYEAARDRLGGAQRRLAGLSGKDDQ
jgi:transcriptional regulator with XRE-family HTH domain